jgi:hypothetical protein
MNEGRFITECIRVYSGNHDVQKLKRLYSSVDIKKLDRLITRQNIEGFFYHLYANNIFQTFNIPLEILSNWKKAAGRNTLINAFNDKEALWLTGLLNKNNIDYIYIKGLSTRIRCYNNDYIKYSVDIDLFIKKDDYGSIKNILLKNDYNIPRDHYIENVGIAITFEEFEKNEHEISFVKKQGPLTSIIDLQWDYIDSDRTSVFHDLYKINSFYRFDLTDEIEIEGAKIKVFDLETDLMNMAFHYAFHHSFRGIQWLIDICTFVRNHESEIGFESIYKNADENLKKILGIVLMLAYDFNSGKKLNRIQRKFFCIDRLLPFEYQYYKSMVFKPVSGISNSISLLVTKILLPYRSIDRVRAFKYMLFNPDSIGHRLEPNKKGKKIFLPFYLFKLLIFDIIRKRKK